MTVKNCTTNKRKASKLNKVEFHQLEKSTALDLFFMNRNIAKGRNVEVSKAVIAFCTLRYERAKHLLQTES